jgi:hypothetical protein
MGTGRTQSVADDCCDSAAPIRGIGYAVGALNWALMTPKRKPIVRRGKREVI